MSAADARYSVRESPLKPRTEWSVQDGVLVRITGRGETRWPLEALTRFTLTLQPNRYGADQRLAQLRFGRRAAGFSNLGWQGVGRPLDQTPAFAAFVRALARSAADRAPGARFEVGGGVLGGAGLWWVAALLGAGVVATVAMAFSSGMAKMGLDLSARLLFVLILLFAAAPWLPGRSSRAFDPHDPPLDSPTR